MKPRAFTALASLLALLIFAGVVVASDRLLASARIDFTSARLYTLSDSARTVVQRVAEPVRLDFVYSARAGAGYPAIRAHAERTREMLAAITALGGGRIQIREIDPEPFSAEEDEAAAAGLTSATTDDGDPLYLGVIGRNTVDDEIAIPFLSPDRDAMLEYDLIRLIAQLDDPDPPTAAIITTLPSMSGDGTAPGDALILRELARSFHIVQVEPDFYALPERADVVVLINPPPLSDWQAWLIDQFILRKGRALIAVDPAARTAQAMGRPVIASDLGALERLLGLSVPAEAIADRSLALPVELDAGGGRRVVEGQPLFIAAPKALMSTDDPVTADLSRPVNFGAPGHILAKPPEGARFTPLVTTSNDAATIDAQIAVAGPDPRAALVAATPVQGEQILAGRLSGELRTAFPDTTPEAILPDDPVLADLARREVARAPERISRSETPAEVIVIADADLFENGFYVDPGSASPLADNAALVLNALDNLGGDPALVSLRSRAPASRPMQRLDDLRAAARERLYAEQEALEGSLASTEAQLAELEGASTGQTLVRTEEQSAAIATLRAEAQEVRGRLRAIEREFRRDIDRIELWLRIVTIWAPAALVILAGMGVFLWRRRGRGGAA
jgi:ABC-2 type transport system permease protein